MVTPQKISSYLRKPYELDATAEQLLRDTIQQYPYFNNAWALLARNMRNISSPRFDTVLKQAAMQNGDRRLLYKLVNLEEKEEAKTLPPITAIPVEIAHEAPAEPAAEQAAKEEIETESTFALHNVEPEPTAVAEQEKPAGKPEPVTEADKFSSAYDEIFGASNKNDEIATDFETFEIEHEPPVEHIHTAEPVAVEYEEGAEESFELDLGQHLDEDNDGLVASEPAHTATEEEFELHIGDELAEIIEEKAEPVASVTEEEEEEKEPEALPIAFKLDTAQPAAQMGENKPVAESGEEPHNFFEWLAHLKKLEPGSEKKNEFVEAPVEEPQQVVETKQEIVPEVVVPEVKEEVKANFNSSADDIINRFINANPTITRQKAEFYNPLAKSKESDTISDDLATETLAKIYRNQHLYEKAIQVYTRLAELHPDKAAEYEKAIEEMDGE